MLIGVFNQDKRLIPTYEYQCECGNRFERVFSIKAIRKTVKCGICGKRAKKIMSKCLGLVFKGKGWPSKELKEGTNDR